MSQLLFLCPSVSVFLYGINIDFLLSSVNVIIHCLSLDLQSPLSPLLDGTLNLDGSRSPPSISPDRPIDGPRTDTGGKGLG